MKRLRKIRWCLSKSAKKAVSVPLVRLLANSLWCLLLLPEYIAFRRAVRNVAAAQQRLLGRLLRQQAASDYGRGYRFGSIATPGEYQARVPLTTYADYGAALEQIGAGRPGCADVRARAAARTDQRLVGGQQIYSLYGQPQSRIPARHCAVGGRAVSPFSGAAVWRKLLVAHASCPAANAHAGWGADWLRRR
ncbi:MAG: GH3 auxin-responsive promoter family protein [Blastochloris sp.]|nr:GH3 auxin-responsive promoter family protein [Blastochloris sp.]